MKPALVAVAIPLIGLASATVPAQAAYFGLAAGAALPAAATQAQGAVQPPRKSARPQRSQARQARPHRREPGPRMAPLPQQARPVETPRWEPGSGY
jgi:hypothetical protein